MAPDAASVTDATGREPVLLCWSGGKDSTLALAALLRSAELAPAGLLTTVTEDYDRISMHGVRSSLLRAQAESLGLPLTIVEIPPLATDAVYADRMAAAMANTRAAGIRKVAFGDLFLRDVREYRERMLAAARMEAVFPVWGRSTSRLAREFVDAGYRAILTCVDTRQIPADFAGRDFDHALLNELPDGADPCGEHGEFHTFVHDGPIFRRPVPCARGGTELRDGRFMYRDLV